jgi:hypothetical protein
VLVMILGIRAKVDIRKKVTGLIFVKGQRYVNISFGVPGIKNNKKIK